MKPLRISKKQWPYFKNYSSFQICKISIVFFLIFVNSVYSQKDYSLLWKISGNGLKKPSYLYGTIHLTDKRIFNFGDSVLLKIEECDAFANEIYLDSLTIKMFEIANQQLDSVMNGFYSENEDEMNKALKETENSSGIDKEYLKKLNPGLLRFFSDNKNLSSKHMDVTLDSYLFGIGKKLNKKITTLEYLRDHEIIYDSLSNSGKEDFISEEILKKKVETTEELIKIYSKSDLNAIDSLFKFMPIELYDKLILKRNMKMIGMIDSISHQMSVFYAVGAGHLPGSAGLIELLRNKGYVVTPVISQATGKWVNYIKTIPKAKWETVYDSINGFKIDFPLYPTKLTAGIEELNLNMAYDVSTNLVFMTCGKVLPRVNENQIEKLLDQIITRMSSNKKYKILKKTKIKPIPNGFFQEVTGKQQGDKYLIFRVYIINNVLYILYAGNSTKEQIDEDRKRFFDSFSLINNNIMSWKLFDAKEDGFEIMMPENPKITAFPVKTQSENSMNVTNIVSTDNKNGIQYFVQYLDGEGLYYPIDSTFFNATLRNIQDALLPIRCNNSNITVQEYPGLEVYSYLKDSTIVRMKTILCSTRGYILYAIYNNLTENVPELNTFFNSFKLYENNVQNYKLQSSPDSVFTVNAFSPFKVSKDKSYGLVDTLYSYTSYDKHSGSTWYVLRYSLSSYAYFENDSSFNSYAKDLLTDFRDSIYSFSRTDSSSNSWEIVTGVEGSHIKSCCRYQLVGNELFALKVYLPAKNDPSKLRSCFFDSFIPGKSNMQINIFIPKTQELINNLSNQDTVISLQARMILNHYNFRKDDVFIVHKALQKHYEDDTLEYYGTRSRLLRILKNLQSDFSVTFIDSIYHELLPFPNLQNDAIQVLSSIQSETSYSLLKRILLNEHPAINSTWLMFNNLHDSLELTSSLYPEVLELINDSIYSNSICDLTATLFDSLILSPKIIQPFEKSIIDAAKKDMFMNQAADENEYMNTGVPRLIRYLDSPESVEYLKLYSENKNMYLKISAVEGLIMRNIDPSDNNLLLLASNDLMRSRLYEILNQNKKLHLFPRKYLAQKYFAASYLVESLLEEDDIPNKLTFIRTLDREFDGKLSRFYLYNIEYNYDGEKSIYLGICGPYNTDNILDPVRPAICYTPWIEYSKRNIEKDMDDFLMYYFNK